MLEDYFAAKKVVFRSSPRVVCHVFESEEASFIAQSIGQAFQVAYVEFLRANGIDDPAYLREIDYQVSVLAYLKASFASKLFRKFSIVKSSSAKN